MRCFITHLLSLLRHLMKISGKDFYKRNTGSVWIWNIRCTRASRALELLKNYIEFGVVTGVPKKQRQEFSDAYRPLMTAFADGEARRGLAEGTMKVYGPGCTACICSLLIKAQILLVW